MRLESQNYFLSSFSSLSLTFHKPTKVIVVNPHDSIIKSPVFQGQLQERKTGFRGSDVNVLSIVKDIASQTNINFVHAVIPRQFLDVNRADTDDNKEDPPYVDSRLFPYYFDFHQNVFLLVQESVETFGEDGVLVLVLHGFKEQPLGGAEYDLILGTQHRESLRRKSCADKNFAKFFGRRGYSVYTPDALFKSGERYNAHRSYVVNNIRAQFDVDVIQIEISSKYRNETARAEGKMLSKAFAEFIKDNY